MTNGAVTPDQALANMLAVLAAYLPPASPPLPAPNVSIVSLVERALAIGNYRGTEKVGPFAAVALKGGRLDAVIRFQIWDGDPGDLDTAFSALHARLLADRDTLWGAGFLRMVAAETGLIEHVPVLSAWRNRADYRILYEYHYQDTGGAESLIARIPIHSDPETRHASQRETTVVTDEMVRWDDTSASPLEVAATVRTRVWVTGLATLAYLPAGWFGAPTTLARLDRHAATPPTSYATLAQFHAAVTNQTAPDRHAQVTFPSVADFLAEFTPAGDPVAMGDWDEDGLPDVYLPGSLPFDPPIRLDAGNDLLHLSYQDPAFDTPAVVYIQAER